MVAGRIRKIMWLGGDGAAIIACSYLERLRSKNRFYTLINILADHGGIMT